MRIKFEGAEADENRLEAYEGIKSIEGLIRVARIATHYAATGEVRFRAPYTTLLEAQISQIQNGSFEMLFDYASRIASVVKADEAKTKAEALFTFLVRRGTGQTEDEDLEVEGEIIPSGDIAAMSEAAESALKASHRWLDDDDKKITVVDGDDSTSLDLETKEYVEEEFIGDEDTRDVRVAAMNVNSKNGRVYLLDEHRTVPFLVHRDATPRTVTNLSRYIPKYAQKTNETVNILYRPVRHIDERIKRLIIFDCFEVNDAA
jgi:hypothetical protein